MAPQCSMHCVWCHVKRVGRSQMNVRWCQRAVYIALYQHSLACAVGRMRNKGVSSIFNGEVCFFPLKLLVRQVVRVLNQ